MSHGKRAAQKSNRRNCLTKRRAGTKDYNDLSDEEIARYVSRPFAKRVARRRQRRIEKRELGEDK